MSATVINLFYSRTASCVLTELEGQAMVEFFMERQMGWDIVMSGSKRGRMDCRTREAKQAFSFIQDFYINSPGFDKIFTAVIGGKDISNLWPAPFREVLRFRLNHTVPRYQNEPLSDYRVQMRKELQQAEWPDFLKYFSGVASATDHPPYPAPSSLYLTWKEVTA